MPWGHGHIIEKGSGLRGRMLPRAAWQRVCDLPGSGEVLCIQHLKPHYLSLSVDSSGLRGRTQRDTSGLKISLQSAAWRFQYCECLHSQGFGCFYFNTEWASLGIYRGIRPEELSNVKDRCSQAHSICLLCIHIILIEQTKLPYILQRCSSGLIGVYRLPLYEYVKPKPQACCYSSAFWIGLAQSGGSPWLPGQSRHPSVMLYLEAWAAQLRCSFSCIKFPPLRLLFYFGLPFIFTLF